MRLNCFLIPLLLAAACGQWWYYSTSGGGGGSNTVLVQSAACNNGSSSGSAFSCSLTATGTGQFAVIVENDADNPGGTPTAPTDAASDTFTVRSGCSYSSGNGHSTYMDGAIASGQTSLTMHPASGHGSAAVFILSGMATSSQLDTCSSGFTNNGTNTLAFTQPITSTQTDVAVGFCENGLSTARHFSTLDVWSNGIDFNQPNDGTDSFAAIILNAVQSQFMVQMSGDSAAYDCAMALYKSAVPGSAPAGNSPWSWMSGVGITDGTALSGSNATSGTHNSYGWGLTASGITWTAACGHALSNPVTVNGHTYTTSDGTVGLSVPWNLNPSSVIEQIFTPSFATETFSVQMKTNTFQTDSNRHAPIVIGDVGGGDEMDIGMLSGLFKVESNTNSSAGWAVADNTWVKITGKFTAGTNNSYKATLYTDAGVSQGEQTATSTAVNVNAANAWAGNQAGSLGGANATSYCIANYEIGGAYPSIP